MLVLAEVKCRLRVQRGEKQMPNCGGATKYSVMNSVMSSAGAPLAPVGW